MVRLILVAAFGIMAGCQSIPKGTFCDLAKPIRLSEAQIEALTDAQVREYLGHNRRGETECGWRP